MGGRREPRQGSSNGAFFFLLIQALFSVILDLAITIIALEAKRVQTFIRGVWVRRVKFYAGPGETGELQVRFRVQALEEPRLFKLRLATHIIKQSFTSLCEE